MVFEIKRIIFRKKIYHFLEIYKLKHWFEASSFQFLLLFDTLRFFSIFGYVKFWNSIKNQNVSIGKSILNKSFFVVENLEIIFGIRISTFSSLLIKIMSRSSKSFKLQVFRYSLTILLILYLIFFENNPITFNYKVKRIKKAS